VIPRWLIISGDLVPTGGMDGALLGLARYLANQQLTEVVAHRISPELQQNPNIRFRKVVRPLGSHLLGSPLLATKGRQRLQTLQRHGTRIIVNGGNCPGSDINWVHYVHAAFRPQVMNRSWRTLKHKIMYSVNTWAERKILLRSKFVICNSRRTADAVIQLGVPPDRAKVVYYGTDPRRFPLITSEDRQEARQFLSPKDQNRPWVVFVGALGDHRKGFDTLYLAWKTLVSSHHWPAKLWVIGSGADRPLWEARAHADGLSSSIAFLGFRQDVPRILAACDLLVHPARYEAYGLGVQEALCRGLPAIVSRNAGVAERYTTELQELLLNNSEDVGELVDRLKHWHTNLDSWPSRVVPLSELLRSRTWDVMATEFVQAVGGITI
jgi:glycosyltransferase involved in cell wall biosynthesis